jgi:hypothetical protein
MDSAWRGRFRRRPASSTSDDVPPASCSTCAARRRPGEGTLECHGPPASLSGSGGGGGAVRMTPASASRCAAYSP